MILVREGTNGGLSQSQVEPRAAEGARVLSRVRRERGTCRKADIKCLPRVDDADVYTLRFATAKPRQILQNRREHERNLARVGLHVGKLSGIVVTDHQLL